MNSLIEYHITPTSPEAHLFSVSLRIAKPDLAGQAIRLPVWLPGSYMVRDFAKHVVSLSATSGNRAVSFTRPDKSTWLFEPINGALQIDYQVYAWDLSVRTAHLDTTHGFFNGSSLCFEVLGQSEQSCHIIMHAPQGEPYQHWRVATTLERDGAAQWGFGRYHAANYDELIDHPVEMGTFTLGEFSACGVPHYVAITGQHRCDVTRLCQDLEHICTHHIQFFGKPAPMNEYLFLVMTVGNGYGGLEHRASTALLCSRDAFPVKGQSKITPEYQEFLGLCSHEYFHTWNVKRLKPQELIPFKLDQEQYTQQLWAFEGITSYYDDLALVRTGLISQEAYLEGIAKLISRVWRGKGRQLQTVTDSSFDAWTKFYKQDENAPNAIVSYYTKGALIALCLDALIRRLSEQQHSLDEVMRLLWQRYYVNDTTQNGGISEHAIQTLVLELLGEQRARAVNDFFELALYSTDDLPIAETLNTYGITLQFEPLASADDWGGFSSTPVKPRAAIASLGARFGESDMKLPKILNAYTDGAAQQAGLSAGDLIVAVDGLRVSAAKLAKTIAQLPVGHVATVHAYRRDELMVFNVPLLASEPLSANLFIHTNANDTAHAARNAWLHTP